MTETQIIHQLDQLGAELREHAIDFGKMSLQVARKLAQPGVDRAAVRSAYNEFIKHHPSRVTVRQLNKLVEELARAAIDEETRERCNQDVMQVGIHTMKICECMLETTQILS